ncbi:ABC-F family ATP-binding cassette domain-containing protein [Neolewinella aurantiaca]|uniref:ABC-F family ATP-binding cassette domain-containing protein n=1 Tax=Neolewinella aurantiaca TaxID=2602767 RepID=A0A5C7FV90_9BACT|nr:ABC-F family ATP-binding cassette domain-containing protein [Neolewinella aurantiaca]TXF89442.1 ABC-F family ATP-binding cassette domain-containing protein [Neolewinella aurantiaca]
MVYLELTDVSKIYGEKVLFDRVSLQVARNTKVALVAKNGTGKSTLLRVAAGIDLPEGLGSEVYIHKDARMAYLPQEPDFGKDATVMDAVFNSDNEMVRAVRDYEEALSRTDQPEKLQNALTRMDRLQAWDIEARIKEVLFKLNIERFDQKVSTLSGGQRKRVALAKLIIDEPDLIIMDEPTNHLDLDMIEWLEEWLQSTNLTLLMVTHDRYFLERVCNRIIELDGGNIYHYTGNYSDFLEKKSIREETSAAELDKDKKRMKKELEWVRRMPSGRGTKAKSRIKDFHELKNKVSGHRSEDELTIEIKGQRLGGKILEAHNIGKSYGDRTLVKGFSYKFQKGERAGIVGRNGAGKSTLLHMLTKELEPDTGKVVHGVNTHFGYYTQDGINLDKDKRVIEAIREIAEFIPLEKGQKLTARGLLNRFMFPDKQQQVYISQLSGGERRRLYLLTILMKNPNFLILDEPTNDLDIMTLNILEDFLIDFPGCVLIVSHDRFFLDKICQHLFIFEEDGNLRDWNGLYTEYRATRKEELAAEKAALAEKASTAPAAAPKKEEPQEHMSQETRKAIRRIEGQLKKLEEAKSKINKIFLDPTGLNPDKIADLGRELNELNEQIEEKEMEWMELVG